MNGATSATPGATVAAQAPGVAHGLSVYAAGCRCDRCVNAATAYAAHHRRRARWVEAKVRAA